MSFFTDEQTLVVPETELNGCKGFALHIGSSTLKLAYIGSTELHHSLNPEFCKSSLELRSTTIDNLDKVIDFIKKNLLEQRAGRHPLRFQAILTGWHGLEYVDKFSKELGVTISLVDPGTAYSRYLRFGVCSVGRPTFLHHVVKCPAKEEPFDLETVKEFMNQEPGIEGPGTDHPQPYEEKYWNDIKKEFPYLLCAVGSDVTYIKVDESGHDGVDILLRSGYGGSAFYATASLATGKKDYKDLLSLANKGNRSAVGFSRKLNDLPERSMECNLQVEGALDREVASAGGLDQPVILKPLERITKGESVPPEDLVAALMHMTCDNLITSAVNLARTHGIRKVYFCGAFVHNNRVLERCIRQAAIYDMKNKGPELFVGLTQHGLYACPLGALLDRLHIMQFFVECGGMCGPCIPPMPEPDEEWEGCIPPPPEDV